MSNTIDNRVLEMRFDNQQFERGVATSMSTLDKLKQKLNLKGASQGLEGVSKAAKNVRFDGMTRGIDTVTARFSALQVAGVTAIANITNQAVNAGKRMASALTIDPIKTGFQEYETQMGAIQTILANTMKEGTNVEIVNNALDELNRYADQTIYNFTEMTRNIGTFTAAGVKLDDSVNAIKGIANLAAVSGSTSQQASTAMYQLSQALAAGKVSLMDWNSVVNAGMGGQLFQDALLRTSDLLQTGGRQAVKTYGSFRESLTQGQWLTTEVLTETLSQLAGAYDKAELMQQGFTEAQADEIVKLAETAVGAATEVKTFTQLWDTLKEAVQSGWAQTWRTIIGDFDEAKELMTGLSNFFGEIIGKSSDNRNAIVDGAIGGKGFLSRFARLPKMIEKINGVTVATEEMAAVAKKADNNYSGLVDKIIAGEFGQGQERIEKLTKAGYDWAHAQNLVNEKLGDSTRHATDYKEAQEEATRTQEEASRAQVGTINDLVKYNDAKLKQLGFTKNEITALRELAKQSELTGIPLEDLVKDIDQLNGRSLLINSFKNAASGLGAVFSSVREAWRSIFWDGASDDEILRRKTDALHTAIATIHRFSTYLTSDKVPVDELTRSFKGLFAVIDIVATIAGGGFKLAFKALSSILGAFDMNILEFTANLGDAIVGFRDWLFESNSVAKAIEKLVDKLPDGVAKIKEWVDAFKETPVVREFVTAIEAIQSAFDKFTSGKFSLDELASKLGTNIAKALMTIPDIAVQIGKDVIAGFQNGIKEGISGSIIGDIVSFCLEFVAAFADALGVQSPSWKTHDIAVDTIQGFINGIREMLAPVISVVKWIGEQIVNAFKFIFDLVTDESGNLEWDKIFSGGLLITGALMVKSFVDAIDGVADAIGGIGDILESAGDALKSFSKVLDGVAWELKAKALMKMAISIAILAGVIALLGQLSWGEIGKGVAAVGALAGVMVLMGIAMDKFGDASVKFNKDKGKLNVNGLKTTILQMGLAILMLGVVVKLIGGMKPEEAKQGFIAMTAMMVELGVFMAVIGRVMKGNNLENITQVGKLMTKMAWAMLLMVAVVKLASGLSADEMLEGVVFAGAFVIFTGLLGVIARVAGPTAAELGKMMTKMAWAMFLMVGVCKLVGLLSAEEMLQGAAFATGFALFVGLLGLMTRAAGKEIPKLGRMMLAMSVSMAILVGVCKLIGMLSAGEIVKGIAFMGAFAIFVGYFAAITRLTNGESMANVSKSILALSVAIGIMAGVVALLSFMDIGALAKGVIAVGALSLMMSLMVKQLKGARKVSKSVYGMVAAIVAMTAAVIALSMVDTADLVTATLALSLLMGMFSLMSKGMNGLKDIKIGPIVAMVVVVGALAGVIVALSALAPESAISSVVSLSILLLAVSGAMRILDSMTSTLTQSLSAVIALTAMTVPLLLFAAILAGMSEVQNAITNAIALSILAGVMAMLLPSIAVAGNLASDLIPGIVALSAMAIPLALFVGVLALMSMVDNAATNALALAALFGVVTVMMTALAVVGPMAAIGVGALTSLAITLGAIAGVLVIIGGLNSKFECIGEFLGNGLDLLIQLGEGLGTAIGKFIGGIGEGIADSMVNVANDLIVFMSAIQAASTVGSTIKPGAFDGMKSVIEVMGEMAIGSIVDKLASMFTGESSMESFKKGILDFTSTMAIISLSLSGVKIDKAKIQEVAEAGQALSDLANAIPKKGGLLQDIVGESDLASFGSSCLAFTATIQALSVGLGDTEINVSQVQQVAKAGKALSDLANAIPKKGGLLQDIMGESDLTSFGASCAAFTATIQVVSNSLGKVEIDSSKFEEAAKAGTMMSDLANAIPKKDGFLQDIVGESDLTAFGTSCGAFISTMQTLSVSLDAVGIKEGNIETAVKAGEMLVALQEALPEEGWFDGKINLDEFSSYISKFGTAMGDFGTKSAEINPESMNTAISAANRIKTLINSLGELNTENLDAFAGGGFSSGAISQIASAIKDFGEKASGIETENITVAITSANRLRSFIASLAGFDSSGTSKFKPGPIGKEMKAFAKSVNGIDPGNVTASIIAANLLKTFISGLAGFDSSGVASFKPGPLGNAMKSYSSAASGVNVGLVTASISAATKVKNFIESLAGFNGSGVGSFQSAISSLSQTNVSTLVATFNAAGPLLVSSGSELISSFARGMESSSAVVTAAAKTIATSVEQMMMQRQSQFRSIGVILINALAGGMRGQAGAVSGAAVSGLGSAAAAANGYYGSFYVSGAYIGSGLVRGIQSQVTAAANAAANMAAQAAAAARDALKINSPSKVFIEIGKGIPEGFTKGIGALGNIVRRSATQMADSAINTTETAMNAMTSLLNGDMDARPTIRPVVDLDDVKSGVRTIGKLFDKQQSVGVMSKLNTLSIQMSERNQNGGNAEVVSAIERLRRGLDNLPSGDTYTFGNVAYSDNSAISDAVNALVRAVKVERRA